VNTLFAAYWCTFSCSFCSGWLERSTSASWAPFDLLVLLILSETVQNSLVGDDTSLIGGLISAATLVILAYGISILTFNSKRLERAIEGTPKILIRHGHRRAAELQRQRITKAELLEALRNHGCANITDVRVAILENDGKITVIKR